MESSASAQGSQVVILLGSKSDMEHRAAIGRGLDRYEQDGQPHVYITVAGRSNALSGVVDANSRHPVIACPPYGERFGGMDLLSSVRMPGGVAPMLVLEPEGAALAAAKILAVGDPALAQRIAASHAESREQAMVDDREAHGG